MFVNEMAGGGGSRTDHPDSAIPPELCVCYLNLYPNTNVSFPEDSTAAAPECNSA